MSQESLSQEAQSDFENLRHMPVLADFDDAALSQLSRVAKEQSYPAGSILFSEGDRHGQIYLVSSGTVRLEMLTAKCGRQTIMSVGRGDLLAWSALIGDGIMTATAVIGEDANLVAFEAADLRRLMEQDAQLGYQLMRGFAKALSRRLLATRLQLLDLFHP